MDSILISFIIAVYNNERFLPNAIDSILQQAVDGIEVIIVDDGSTDNSGAIADRYAKENHCVRVVHQQNQWIYASFNNGIKEARGEYIYILNSDDKLFDNSITFLLNRIREYNHPDVVWTKMVSTRCDENQNKIEDYEFPTTVSFDQDIYSKGEEVHQIWPRLRLAGLSETQANLYRRNLAINHPFRNDVYGADTYFNLNIAKYVNTCLVVTKPIYNYMVYMSGKGNTSRKYYPYEHEMRTDIYKKYRKLFSEWELDESLYKKALKVDRMRFFTVSIRALSYRNCELSIEEKIKKVFLEYLDTALLECADWTNCRRELESRTLNGVAELLSKEELPRDSEMAFVYDLISGLPEKYDDDIDFDNIESDRMRRAIFHSMNPAHIGEVYYGLNTRGTV